MLLFQVKSSIKNSCGNTLVGGLFAFKSIEYPELSWVTDPPVLFSYPYGPYIGRPSYAQPIIGECCVLFSSTSLDKVKSLLPYKGFPSELFWYTIFLKPLGAYACEHCNSRLSCVGFSMNTSESSMLIKFFLTSFTCHVLRLTLKIANSPADSTLSEVVEAPYPIPPFIILTDLIWPSTISGTNSAPVPIPVTEILGGVLYDWPLFWIATSIIDPPATTGNNSPLTPVYKSTLGCLLKLSISDAPYPTPPFVKWTDVTSPLNKGWGTHWKVLPSIELIPIIPSTFTEIGS